MRNMIAKAVSAPIVSLPIWAKRSDLIVVFIIIDFLMMNLFLSGSQLLEI